MAYHRWGSATLLVWHTIRQLKMINLWHVFQQMAHLGVDSLPIISLTLLFAGAVTDLTEITDVLITYGAQSTVGGLMAVAMGRELGPILVGVVLAGRVGAAITAGVKNYNEGNRTNRCASCYGCRSYRLSCGTSCSSMYDYGANFGILWCSNWDCGWLLCGYCYQGV